MQSSIACGSGGRSEAPASGLTYRVVYDVRHAMPNVWWLIMISLVLGPVGYGIYRQAHRFESSKTGFVGLFLGVRVRVWDVGGRIARLEIAQ